MQEGFGRTTQKYAPSLQRVLVLDAHRAPTRALVELLRELGADHIRSEGAVKGALPAAHEIDPQIIFTEYGGPGWDGLQFVRSVRRGDFACRQAPIIMVTEEANAHAILGARDAGVHEFLRKPYTLKDLIRRIDAVTLGDRDWIEAVGYVGPDRRRFNSGEYAGPRKRKSDVRAAPDYDRLDQALRIVRSALAALEEDPRQALRSLQAQAVDLAGLAALMRDAKLASGAASLQRQLDNGTQLTRASLEAAAKPLLLYLPPTWAA